MITFGNTLDYILYIFIKQQMLSNPNPVILPHLHTWVM